MIRGSGRRSLAGSIAAARSGAPLLALLAGLGASSAVTTAASAAAADPSSASVTASPSRSAIPTGAEPAPGPGDSPACVLIDNDYDVDDMMAIPLVLGAGSRVAAIVQTEGYSLPAQAAAAIDPLLHGPATAAPAGRIPILVGGSQAKGPDLSPWPWLPFIRAMMARSNGLLAQPPAPWSANPDYPQAVQRAVAGCTRLSVLITGPFTSFVRYSPLIRERITRVVISGKRIGDRSRSPGRNSFNCDYDLAACRLAMLQLQGLNSAFVVVPNPPICRPSLRPPPQCYTPDLAMVLGSGDGSGRRRGGLLPWGLPGRLQRALVNATPCAALLTTPETRGHPCSSLASWEPAAAYRGPRDLVLFWDLATALQLVHPSLFSPYVPPADPATGGQHLEPTLVNGSHQQTLERLRRVWTAATNRAASGAPAAP